MSHSPSGSSTDADEDTRHYRRYLARLDRMLEDGASWSGQERNCAFLNLGTTDSPRAGFAPISFVSGLDFLDDGRAHALVDWDADGDLDVWTTNRTSPRLRMMRNDQASGNHFLAVHLQGTSCNRDAIGARVEVRLTTPSSRPLVNTLRAGHGFLAQSSKCLHFGLGRATSVEAVVVHWPDGLSQTFRNIEVDGFYELVQGAASARRLASRGAGGTKLSSAPLPTPPSSLPQVLLSSRLPLPRIPIRLLDGSDDSLLRFHGRPIWLVLWASWCQPCRTEMQQISRSEQRLRDSHINVVALSLDGLDQPALPSTGVDDAQTALNQLAFPFAAAMATAETVRRLQFADQQVFGRESEVLLPSSYLLTAEGELAAVYRGSLAIDRLLSDAEHVRDDHGDLLQAALPFPGIWFDGRRRLVPLAMVAHLMDQGDVVDAANYVRLYHKDLSRQAGHAEVIGALGTQLAQRARIDVALEMYRLCLKTAPNNIPVLNNLAWQLATHTDESIRDPQSAIHYAEMAARLTHNQSPAILDTLATAYAAANLHDRARTTWQLAIELADQRGQSDFAARLRQKRSNVSISSAADDR